MALIKEMLQKFLRKYEEWQATRREFITEANVQWRTFLRHGAHSFEEFEEGEPNRLSHFWCWRCPAYPIKHPVVHLVVLLTKHSSRRCSTKFPTRIHTNEQTSKRASLTCANDGRPPNKKEKERIHNEIEHSYCILCGFPNVTLTAKIFRVVVSWVRHLLSACQHEAPLTPSGPPATSPHMGKH